MHHLKPFILLAMVLMTFVLACTSNDQSEGKNDLIASKTGEELAKIYCINCHIYPEPDFLPKDTWENYMLPRMGYVLGIYPSDSVRNDLIEKGAGGQIVEAANIFPKEPLIDEAAWEKIQAFYLAEAPETPAAIPPREIKKGLSQFKVRIPDYKLSPPSTTLVRFTDRKTIQVGDALTQSFYEFDQNLNLLGAAKTREGAVWVEENPRDMLITVMGSFSPTDAPSGLLLGLPKQGGKAGIILDSLQRPVHSAYGDLNQDGLMDIIVCEFGKWTGGLSLWLNSKENGFQRQYLRKTAGATKAYIEDMNKDGRPDVVALFGQSDEGISIFYNEGNGTFKEDKVLRFHPSYGSAFFNLMDFNKDGALDFVYCNGDNADYKPFFKDYHGIRVFLNDGNNQFSESFFYQLNGAYNAIPRDFDQDGDIDIAAISFFPDFHNKQEESIVYLENKGDLTFEARTIDDPTLGRWIVMDAADYDEDGDEDLIVGALTFEVVPKGNFLEKWVNGGIPFIVLENTLK